MHISDGPVNMKKSHTKEEYLNFAEGISRVPGWREATFILDKD